MARGQGAARAFQAGCRGTGVAAWLSCARRARRAFDGTALVEKPDLARRSGLPVSIQVARGPALDARLRAHVQGHLPGSALAAEGDVPAARRADDPRALHVF